MATLDITAPAPRVNGTQLGGFVGKKVTVVGRVEGVEGNALRLRTGDEQLVTITLQGIAPQAAILEVQGVVQSPNTVAEESCSPFVDTFDLKNYDELCKLANSQAYRHMFMP